MIKDKGNVEGEVFVDIKDVLVDNLEIWHEGIADKFVEGLVDRLLDKRVGIWRVFEGVSSDSFIDMDLVFLKNNRINIIQK